MPDSAARHRRSLGLALAAIGLVGAIVVGPFLLVREAHRKSEEAAAAVSHAHEVAATTHALMFELRNRESAALAYTLGFDSAIIGARLEDSARAVPQHLARLTELTRDDPEQQVRIGRLASAIDERSVSIREIIAQPQPPGDVDPERIRTLLERNQLRGVADAIVQAEQGQLRRRAAVADALGRRSIAVTWIAMVVQLLLLAGLGAFLYRAARFRRDAELAASRSSARAQAVL